MPLALLLLYSAGGLGCASQSQWVTFRSTPRNPLVTTLDLLAKDGPKPTPRTEQVLRRYDLAAPSTSDAADVLEQLIDMQRRQPSREVQYSIAELAYIAGNRLENRNKSRALSLYGTSLLYAYQFLFDDSQGLYINPYDPQFRGACDLYNQSLEATLRIVQTEGDLRPGVHRTVETVDHSCSFDVVLHSSGWHDEDVDNFKFVSDYQLAGLRNHYHTYGLGVPLIAERRQHDGETGAEQFYPDKLAFPLTAFLRIDSAGPLDGNAVSHASKSNLKRKPPRFVLELHDPLDRQSIQVAGAEVPMESDLSTPLAYFLNQPEFELGDVSTLGLLHPGDVEQLQGLYMLEPFDPNKMPVVMVHGLWSSPVTWMEMFNDLRSDPHVRDRYQFWFYLYPTGQPFWVSASQMRKDLAA
ncbi:MAG: esterase/lipase family protein, partial [Aeoliella sp.]